MSNERSVPRCDHFYLHLSIFISFVPILRLSECGLFWYFWFWAWFFHLKCSKICKKKFYVDSKFFQLEIFPNQIFQNYDFGLLINIYLYKVKIYLLRSCSTWLANMINLIWCSHSGPDPVRWCGAPVLIHMRLTFAIFLPFEAMLCIQYKFSLIWKNAIFLQLMCYAEK